MSAYQPPQVGDRLNGMEWTADETWAPICPADDVAMTEYNSQAELCCPVCGVSLIERRRAGR